MKYFVTTLNLYIIILLLLSINVKGKENNGQVESLLKELGKLNQNVQQLVQQYKKITDDGKTSTNNDVT